MVEKIKCNNCHEIMIKGDKFCKYCGTPLGEGTFEPYDNLVPPLYAPPIKVHFKCLNCGYNWTAIIMLENKIKFCPECGERIETK